MATASKPKEPKVLTVGEIVDKAKARAFRGGLAGAGAMGLQVTTLMWMRTTMNYQYRFGGSFPGALSALYKEGGIRRFYRGFAPALLQGPLSRFFDTAANEGVKAIMESRPETDALPVLVKTQFASITAACMRIFLMPIDTVKTTLQVQGAKGVSVLRAKLATGGPQVLWHGSMGAVSATYVGHYPWFATYNVVDSELPHYDHPMKEMARNASVGFCASFVSDCTSNSLRVVKTYRQTNDVNISYPQAAREVIAKDGVIGLFGRGLQTRILANGMQGMMFSVLWKYFMKLQER